MILYLTTLIKHFNIPDSSAEFILKNFDDDLILRCIAYSKTPYIQEISIYSWIHFKCAENF